MQLSKNRHLSKAEIIKNGSYFTGKNLTHLVREMLSDRLSEDAVLLELGAGYGAFLEEFASFRGRIIASENDEASFALLRENFQNVELYRENSLVDVSRQKYGITDDAKLVIIGNPPYNDRTSEYRKGEKGDMACDKDILSRDCGIAFLKAYDKLKADTICVLHPFSYLAKKQNFKNLGAFTRHYRLKTATLFSSKEFESIRKKNADFPVVAALYVRDEQGMTYQDICDFTFSVYGEAIEFRLGTVPTIDGIIKKYPKKGSECELQFYTQRDINSLLRNTGFVRGPIANGIDVDVKNLYQYAWLLFQKENFNPPRLRFLYGNLSPLYSPRIEEKDVKNALVAYAYDRSEAVSCLLDKSELEREYGPLVQNQTLLGEILSSLYF